MTTSAPSTPVAETSVTLTHNEALAELRAQKGRYGLASGRAAAHVMYVEGKEAINPAFTFVSEDARAKRAWENIIRLKTALAVANARRQIDWEGRKLTLAEGVIRQKELEGEIARLKSLRIHEHDDAQTRQRRTGTEYEEVEVVTKHRSHLTERQRTDAVEALEARRRSLAAAINRINNRCTVTVQLLPE